jgi:hypothetical protein
MTRATTMKMTPTPRVEAQATTSFSASPARFGKSRGKMSREMMLAWRFKTPEMLDMVALNIAASMMPTSPFGSRLSAARAYEDSCGF